MVVIFILVSIVAVGLLVYGILTHRKRMGAADITVLPDIKVLDRNWVPVILVLSDEIAELERLKGLVKAAIQFWNLSTGIDLFGPLDSIGAGKVVTIMSSSEDYNIDWGSTQHTGRKGPEFSDSLGYTRLRISKDGTLKDAAVYLSVGWTTWENAQVITVLVHELGHVLGLGHDGHPGSVMYPIASSRKYAVSEKDRGFLKGVYG